ncbi:hypothetical protein MXEN_17518 [Mycobacterium xenopi RIVM700367]|nr:hypothetical protein MXEN_17518 [Mycobacterium xenopi RIVM700367]
MKTWKVDVFVDEHPRRTRAKVEMYWRDRKLTGIGFARRNPADENIAEIGHELAVARALSNLADQLFAITAADVNEATHEPAVIMH